MKILLLRRDGSTLIMDAIGCPLYMKEAIPSQVLAPWGSCEKCSPMLIKEREYYLVAKCRQYYIYEEQ